ncbi:hypothetical protein [Antrihabitans spumae]|uniref:Minor tail protein n=1 Tax=Antrihabitans spumae TaxID=3373370 RepID=A0ABW7KDT9_9NOCA
MERLPRRTPSAQFDIVDLVLDALSELPVIGDILDFLDGVLDADGVIGMIADAIGDFIAALIGLLNFIPGAGSTLSDLAAGLNSTHETAEEAAEATGNLDARVTALENGGTRTVYTSNASWSNPGAGRVGVAVINGGQGGQSNNQGSGNRLGGAHGGYVFREFNCADLTSTVAITVGAGGATSFGTGGVSSFGAYLVGISGSPGSILTSQGAVASASTPGVGGQGATGNADTATNGGSSALATGGAHGTKSVTGSAGQSVSTGSVVPCGGGGGGGGGGNADAFGQPGDGGAGGAPGGGGGGAGANGGLNPAAFASGGIGGNGRVILIFTPGAA